MLLQVILLQPLTSVLSVVRVGEVIRVAHIPLSDRRPASPIMDLDPAPLPDSGLCKVPISVPSLEGDEAGPVQSSGRGRIAAGLGALASMCQRRTHQGSQTGSVSAPKSPSRNEAAVASSILPHRGRAFGGVLPSLRLSVADSDPETSAAAVDDRVRPWGLLSLTSIQGRTEEAASKMCGVLERELERIDARRRADPCMIIGFT